MEKDPMKPIKKADDQSVEEVLSQIVDPRLRKSLASIHQHMQERDARAKNKPIPPETALRPETLKPPDNVIQLPLWAESTRGVPNSVLRGALFAAIQGKTRRYMKREPLETPEGIEIRFTGMQLDQSDLDVWEQCLQLARQHPLGTHCHFSAHGFLKALGRSTGKMNHEWLKDVFARLGGCFVEITHKRITYGGSLLEFCRDEDNGVYVLSLNPKLVQLYGFGMWTAVDWEQRQQLRRKPLALWLQGFYASHAKTYPMKVETLMALSGSQNAHMGSFKRQLQKAHDDLVNIGAIRGYEIENDLVTIDRSPSNSQRRHLIRPKPRKK